MALATIALLGALFVSPAQADEYTQVDPVLAQLGNSQIFNDDLDVEEGEVIRSNVVLYDGDAKVRDGGRIEGNLVVYSGDIEIREGGSVAGDVSAFSGDIKVKGTVEGNIASWSGDVSLEDTAQVEGDISVLSGDIKRHNEAYVGGNVVNGPGFIPKIPAVIPPIGLENGVPATEVMTESDYSSPGFLERLGNFILRLLAGLGLTIIFVPLAGLIAYSKPEYINRVERTIREQTALSFAAGLLTNVVGGLLISFLVVTICMAIFSILPFFALLGLNLLGWTAVSGIVGKRIGGWLKLDVSTAVLVVLGALALSALVVPFFALGGCFRFMASIAVLLIGAFGVGGVILSWRESREEPKQLPPPTPAGMINGPTTEPPATNEPETPEPPAVNEPLPADEPPPIVEPVAEPPAEDDFTEIDAINAVMDARLKVAGVRTFADLATSSPEQIAGIFSWTAEEVQSEQIVEKARVLAGL